MRIAVDASVLDLPCPTGVERVAREMLGALAQAGPAVDVVIPISRRPLGLVAATGGILDPVETGGGCATALWRETALPAALADHGADVLWSPVAAIPLRVTIPVVATVHELPWLVRPGLEGRVRERVHAMRLRLAVARAAGVVCPSEATRAQVLAAHPDAAGRVHVVPHGVADVIRRGLDEAEAGRLRRAAGAPERGYLLHVGGNRARKDLDLLLEAYRRFAAAGGDAGLVMVGPGAAPAPLPDRVLPLGYVRDEELVALYDGALALVVSSVSEGFGLPVLEAMARGVPVVCTSAGGLPEAAGGAALTVRPGDAPALAAAMVRVAGEPDLRRDLSAAGRGRADGATWSKSAAALRGVLAAVVGDVGGVGGARAAGGVAR